MSAKVIIIVDEEGVNTRVVASTAEEQIRGEALLDSIRSPLAEIEAICHNKNKAINE